MEEKKPKRYCKKLIKKISKNYWAIAAIILAIILLIVLIFQGSGGVTSNVINKNEAGQKLIEFAKSQGADATLIEVNEEANFYEVIIMIDGQTLPVYITKDGEFLAQLIPLETEQAPSPNTQNQQPQEVQGYSAEDIEKISVFIGCLAEKGVKIYGANWCGWTQKLVVDTLGGFDIAAPIYVECTENEELCSQEGISGYPTIKIDGELYTNERTFEGLSEATGCEAPDVGVIASSDTQDASCG